MKKTSPTLHSLWYNDEKIAYFFCLGGRKAFICFVCFRSQLSWKQCNTTDFPGHSLRFMWYLECDEWPGQREKCISLFRFFSILDCSPCGPIFGETGFLFFWCERGFLFPTWNIINSMLNSDTFPRCFKSYPTVLFKLRIWEPNSVNWCSRWCFNTTVRLSVIGSSSIFAPSDYQFSR